MCKEKSFAEEVMDMMKVRFGNAVKAYWVYDDELCPCCMSRPVDFMTYNKQKAVSINGFMYRERGVLIAYLLCGDCAQSVLVQKNDSTPMHKSIEKNLITAYQSYLNSLNA